MSDKNTGAIVVIGLLGLWAWSKRGEPPSPIPTPPEPTPPPTPTPPPLEITPDAGVSLTIK